MDLFGKSVKTPVLKFYSRRSEKKLDVDVRAIMDLQIYQQAVKAETNGLDPNSSDNSWKCAFVHLWEEAGAEKKHLETVEQEVIPRKPREGEDVRTVRA